MHPSGASGREKQAAPGPVQFQVRAHEAASSIFNQRWRCSARSLRFAARLDQDSAHASSSASFDPGGFRGAGRAV
eukprot:12176265-Alexandrium_andersonii.AAC.1